MLAEVILSCVREGDLESRFSVPCGLNVLEIKVNGKMEIK